MADDGIKLGSAYVEFDARVKEAEAELAGFEVKAEQAASRAQASADKSASAYEDSSRRSVTALQAVENALTGLGGASDPTKVTQARQLVDGIGSAADRAKQQAADMGNVISEVQAEADLKLSGIGHNFDTVGSSAERAGKKSAASGGAITGALDRANEASSRLQRGFARIAMPAALVASVVAMVSNLRNARREADNLRRSFKDIGDEFVAQTRNISFGDKLSEIERLRVESSQSAQKQVEAINRGLDDHLDKAVSISNSLNYLFGSYDPAKQVEAAAKETDKIYASMAQRNRAIARLEEEARQKRIESAREIADAIRGPEEQDPMYAESARVSKELDDKIEALKEIRKGLDEDGQAVVTQIIIGAYRDAEARVREVSEKNRAEMAESLKREAEQLRDASLTPIQKEIKELEKRRDEVVGQIDSGMLKGFDGLESTARTLITQLDSSIKDLIKEQNEAIKELPVQIGEQFREALDRALSDSSIVRTPATLDAMLRNLDDLVLQTLRRS